MNKFFYVFTLGILNLADLQFLVLDEADTLMDENFRSVTQDILDQCHVRLQYYLQNIIPLKL